MMGRVRRRKKKAKMERHLPLKTKLGEKKENPNSFGQLYNAVYRTERQVNLMEPPHPKVAFPGKKTL